MIQKQTKVTIADNSGAYAAKTIQVLKNPSFSKSQVFKYAIIAIKIDPKATKRLKNKIYKALIISSTLRTSRKNGNIIKFGCNRVLILRDLDRFWGTVMTGPVAKEAKNAKINKFDEFIPIII